MADATTMNSSKLGVGQIVGETLTLFFSRFGYLALIGIIPSMAIVLIEAAFGPSDAVVNARIEVTALTIVPVSLITAMVVRLSYDAKMGKPIQIGSYLSSALSAIVPIVVCSVIVAFAAAASALLFVIPIIMIGSSLSLLLVIPAIITVFYVFAAFSAVTPAIVVEKAGFGALKRSLELTRNYRWSCVGVLTVLLICVILAMILFGAVVTIIAPRNFLIIILLNSVLSGITMPFFSVAIALLYARLREIKEGTSVEQLAEVFA